MPPSSSSRPQLASPQPLKEDRRMDRRLMLSAASTSVDWQLGDQLSHFFRNLVAEVVFSRFRLPYKSHSSSACLDEIFSDPSMVRLSRAQLGYAKFFVPKKSSSSYETPSTCRGARVEKSRRMGPKVFLRVWLRDEWCCIWPLEQLIPIHVMENSWVFTSKAPLPLSVL